MMTGDAANADPVCDKSPFHHIVTDTVERAMKVAVEAEGKQDLHFRDDANSLALAGAAKPPIA
jgi:pyrroloquinoline quinone biosynthesis protein E